MSTDLDQRQTSLFADLEHAANIPAGSLRMTGLVLVDDLPFEDWKNLGRGLGAVRRWASWAIGDWYLYGEAVYGEEASQASETTRAERMDVLERATGLAPATLQNYASICNRVPIDRRRVELDFSTHEAVAALEPAQQDEWLQRAVDEGWGKGDLRDAIKAAATPPPADPPPAPPGPSGGDEMTIGERIESAARRCFHQAQRAKDGSAVVPPEPWAVLTAALGEE